MHRPIERSLAGDLVTAAPGARALDAGWGDGIDRRPFAPRLRITAVDHQGTYGPLQPELPRCVPNFGGMGWPLVERTRHRWFVSDSDSEENRVTHY